MDSFLFLVFYFIFCCVAAAIASKKGRRPVTYFLLSILVTPFIGIILALVARPDVGTIEQERIAAGTERKCPFCAELVKREAVVCRFCGKDLPPAGPSEGAPRFTMKAEYEAWKAKGGG